MTVTNPGQPSYVGTSISTTGFSGYQVLLAYADSGATVPTSASDTAGTVTFDFLLSPGSSTDPLIIYTNATSYTSGGITLGSLGLDPPAYAPSGSPVSPSATPEPSTLSLLGTGIACVLGAARRRVGRKP